MFRNLRYGMSTNKQIVKTPKLIYVAVGCLGIYAYDQYSRFQAYKTNTFLSQEQIADISIKNITQFNNKPLYGHSANQVNQLKSKDSVIIVGGGIIGVTQALRLLQEGYNVTIIESESEAATQCSAYNGNVYNPMYFLPIVTRDNLITMAKNIFEPPEQTVARFNFNMIFEKNFIMWAFNALTHSMTNEQQLHNSRCQLKLGKLTMNEAYRLKPTGLFKGGHLEAQGQLGFFASDAKVDAYSKKMELLGIPHLKIDSFDQIERFAKQDLKSINNLTIFNKFKKALILPTESNLETKIFTVNVVEYCLKHYKSQFQIAYNTTVDNFVIDPLQNVRGLSTNKGVILGDKFILCAAHKTKYLTEKLKLTLPIIPAKGWAMGAEIPSGSNLSFLKAFTLNSPNYFASITMGKLRLAGCAEVCHDDPKAKKGNVDYSTEWGAIQMLNKFNEQFGLNMKMQDFTVRSCYRPLAPDDVAIIGDVPKFPNVLINAGHGSRGMSYCFGCAEMLTQIMQGSKDFEEFHVKRFYLI